MTSSEPTPDLQEIHDFLIDLAKVAGDTITSARPSTTTFGTKINSADLVTQTDKAVETTVSTALAKRYPTYTFLGEETATSTSRLTDAPTFIVDPIDGTTNFVHGHPYISISLAFAHHRRPLVGVVYNPFTQNLYTAIKGRGAFLTCPSLPPPSAIPHPGAEKKVVECSYTTTRLPLGEAAPLTKLDKCLVAVEWGNERSGSNYDCKTATFAALAAAHHPSSSSSSSSSADGEPAAAAAGPTKTGMVHSLRSLGSAALNMCAVAAGHVDVYWEGGCWAWDVAAGWVVVEEAGGLVVGGMPGEWEGEVDARRYLVVRGGEGGRGIVEEFWGLLRGGLRYAV